ncbi:hypothetical protein ABPG73_008497 [Tetrahymena malaccensis]
MKTKNVFNARYLDAQIVMKTSPYSQNECQQSCPQSYYQNEITKVCEKVNKCLQIQNQQILHLDQIAYQIELINENQYLVRTKECTFLLIDQNLNVISVQVLQNDPIFEAQNMIYGVELIQKSFIVGTYGGCSINNSLVVMDFKTLNIVFNQTNIVYDLGVYFVDQADKIVLFGTLQIFKLFWYDAVTQKLNQIDVNFNFVGSIVLWQNITNTYYFIRISQNGYTMNNGAISNLNINPPNINSGIQMQFYLKCDQNLLVVYYPVLQIVDLLTGQYSEKFIKKSQIQFQNNQSIKHAIKLQTLHFEDYSNNFWNIPFANEDRQNFNDPQSNESKLLCLLIQQATKVYGKNIGSTLRSISLNQKDISTTNGTVQQNENREIEIRKFKSGDFIQFKKIQLLDEENNPVSLEFMSEDIYSQCSSDVQAIVQQISISLKWDLTDLQIQCSGQIQTKEFINDGFNLNGQIMYKPLSQINIQIVSNIFPQLLDSKGNIYLNQRYLQKDLLFYFSDCSIGDIVKTQGNSVICDQCSDGKYSLNINDTECKQCPDTALKCQGSNIQLKDGYWRESKDTDQIVYCNFNPEACQAEAPYSKFNCITGYIGPLCSSCDIYGELWGDSYSQIFQDASIWHSANYNLQ